MDDVILHFKEKLKSDKTSIRLIEPLVMQVKGKLSLGNELLYNVLIASTEAVNNAIIHGNKCNPKKDVIFTLSASENQILITVQDEGKGFNPDSLEDPRMPENLMKEGGRGVFLIRELTDSSEIISGKKGTIVTMVFNII